MWRWPTFLYMLKGRSLDEDSSPPSCPYSRTAWKRGSRNPGFRRLFSEIQRCRRKKLAPREYGAAVASKERDLAY